jgi:hypothetical protein
MENSPVKFVVDRTFSDPEVAARFELATVADLDKWAASHGVSRSEAIRRLVELGLRAKSK